MPSPLTVKPSPRDSETLFSLLSRAAAMRGLGTWNFTTELGLAQKKLISLETSEVNRVAELFELSPAVLKELISWTPKPLAGVRMEFRGEEVVSRAVKNPEIRGCPICLRDDLLTSEHARTDGLFMRGSWHFKHVILCNLHKTPLVTLWTEDRLNVRYDFSTKLKFVADDLLRGRYGDDQDEVTTYDVWIDKRLREKADSTFLGQHSIDVAANFCLLLGAAIQANNAVTAKLGSNSPAARALGFDVAVRGNAAITDVFQDLASDAGGPRLAFGVLHRWLAHHSLEDPRYNPFRQLMRRVILKEWAIPGGTTVLGKSLPVRKLHSITSAASALNVAPSLLRDLLIAENVIGSDGGRPDSRTTFDAIEYASLLDTISRLIHPKELRRLLNCKVGQFKVLVKMKVLEPRFPAELTRQQWDSEDAEKLLQELSGPIMDESMSDADFEHIHAASVRTRVGINDVISAVRSGELQAYLKSDLVGYQAVFVSKSAVDAIVRPDRPEDPTVAEFARTVGLYNNGEMTALVAAGYVVPTAIFNPRICAEKDYITPKVAELFHQRFTTTKILSGQMNKDARAIAHLLRKNGIERFRPSGTDFGFIYLFEDVAAFLRAHEPEKP